MRRSLRVTGALTLSALLAVALSGCSTYRGLNSVVLPGGTGTGEGSYIVTAEFDTASNLVPNAEVKVNDVTVGTVRSITLNGWHAQASLGLRDDVALPANAAAKIGQKSLLGASYVELAPPRPPEQATGRLRDGDVIPLVRTGRYPETEELLGTLSLWLNGGGLAQAHTITTELNKALGGNEPAVRDLVHNLDTFTGTLDAQRGRIVSTVESVDRLAATLSARSDQLGPAIETIGPGLRVLNEQRGSLIEAIKALDRLSVVGDRTLDRSGGAVRADVHDLRPVVHGLANAGDDLPNALDALLTVFLPVTAIPSVAKGDYASVSTTLDLTASGLTDGYVPGTAADEAARLLDGRSPVRNPFTDLLNNTIGGNAPSSSSPRRDLVPHGLLNRLGGG